MKRWGAVTITWCGVWIIAVVTGKLYDSLVSLGATGTLPGLLLALNLFTYVAGVTGLPIIVGGWLFVVVRAAVRPRAPRQRLPLATHFTDAEIAEMEARVARRQATKTML